MSFGRTRTWLTVSVVTLAVCGALCSGILLAHHDGGWSLGDDEGTSYLLRMCSSRALPSVSCADVVGSRWGSFDFYLGARRFLVPLSFIGFGYFVTLAIWFTFTGFPTPSDKWRFRPTAAVVSAGVCASLALTSVMWVSLHRWCPLCVAAHVANIAILLVIVAGYRRLKTSDSATTNRRSPERPLVGQRRLAVLGIATSIATVAGAWLFYESSVETRRYWRQAHGLEQVIKAMQDDADLTLREFFAQPLRTVPTKEASLGDHRPTMTVFRSFDSDASACFEQDWREEFAAAVGESLRVEYRHTPLELVEARRRGEPLDKNKTAASRAVEAARLQNNQSAYNDLVTLLFRQRNVDVAPDFRTLAGRAGLDIERFERDMASDRVRESVEADIALAAALGVDHTPAIFIEGRRVPSLCLKSGVFWKTIGQAPGLTESIADCGISQRGEVATSSGQLGDATQ